MLNYNALQSLLHYTIWRLNFAFNLRSLNIILSLWRTWLVSMFHWEHRNSCLSFLSHQVLSSGSYILQLRVLSQFNLIHLFQVPLSFIDRPIMLAVHGESSRFLFRKLVLIFSFLIYSGVKFIPELGWDDITVFHELSDLSTGAFNVVRVSTELNHLISFSLLLSLKVL